MFSTDKCISDTRAIVYGLVVLLALTVLKYGFFMQAFGLIFGVGLSSWWLLMQDGEDMPMGWAVLVTLAGVALWALGLYVAGTHGVAVSELRRLPDLGRFTRSLDLNAGVTITIGCFLVLANLIGRNKPDDAG